MSTQELQAREDSGAIVPGSSAGVPLSGILFRAEKKMWQRVAMYISRRALRRAESELMLLDDRMLHDIGVTRAEIPAAVRRANAHLLMPIVPQ